MNIKNSWKACFTFDIKVGPFRSGWETGSRRSRKALPGKIHFFRSILWAFANLWPSMSSLASLLRHDFHQSRFLKKLPPSFSLNLRRRKSNESQTCINWWLRNDDLLIEHKTTAKSCSIVFITPHEIKINFRLIINHLLRLIHLWLFPFHSDERAKGEVIKLVSAELFFGLISSINFRFPPLAGQLGKSLLHWSERAKQHGRNKVGAKKAGGSVMPIDFRAN